MTYTVALTQTGQMTLPKALREFLGIDGARRVTLEKRQGGLFIRRKMTREEYEKQMDNIISPESRAKMHASIREDQEKGITTVNQMMQAATESPEMQAYWRKKYGF